MSLFLTCTFLVLATGLHVKYHDSPESYLSNLKAQQNSITSQIQNIKSSISQTQQNVATQTDTLKKIAILEQAILQQKNQLGSLATSLKAPLNESSWSCQNLIGTTQSELDNLANNIINSTNYISQSVNKLSNSTTSQYYKPDSTAASQTSQALKGAIDSTGSNVNPLNTTKQTNWLAPNWITGNQTLQQVDQQTKQTEQNNGYVETCPINTPYFDGYQCIACSSKTPYFNVQTKACTTCDIYDPSTHACKTSVTPSTSYNQSNYDSALDRIILPPNVPANSLTNQSGISCPVDRPFLSNGQCINCNSPTPLFNYSTSSCTTCPAGTTLVIEKHQCIGPNQVYVTNLPSASNRLILPSGTKISDLQNQQNNLAGSQTVVPCPADTPFYNNQSCINCPSGQFFNVQTLQCQSCPSGSTYNQTTYSCITTKYYSNLNNRNWTSTNPQSTRQAVNNASTAPQSSPCPDNTPFYDGSKCISCPSGQQFSFDGLKCQSCPSGTVFSVNEHSCKQPQTGMYQTNVTTAPNLIYDGTSKGEWITIYKQNEQKNPQIADCPSSTSYFDGISCINCPTSHPYFNLRYQLCQVCQQNSKYDANVHQCLTQSGDIISQQPNIEKMVASIFT